MGFFLNNIT